MTQNWFLSLPRLIDMFKNNFKEKGFTLIEMLVVIALFAGLAVLVGSMVGSSMKGTKKSESAMKVRAELENAVSIFERSLRGAKKDSVKICNSNTITFTDQDDLSVTFTCSPLKKSGTELINSSNINLTACNFDCTNLRTKGVVVITLTGSSASSSGVEVDIATVSARVVLRNY